MQTLPDRIGPNLRLLLVGINPSVYAVQQGHYFARKGNRFWPAFSASRLGRAICTSLGVERLFPEHDVDLPRFGIGLTDVVKIPSSNCSAVTPEMFREGVPTLRETIRSCGASVIAFHGLTAYRPFAWHALGVDPKTVALGLQPQRLEQARLFVVPNPSGANAHFRLSDQVEWYDRLADVVEL